MASFHHPKNGSITTMLFNSTSTTTGALRTAFNGTVVYGMLSLGDYGNNIRTPKGSVGCSLVKDFITITVPTVTNTTKTFSGSVQSPTISNVPSTQLVELTGTTSARNYQADEYSFTYKLRYPDICTWSDGSKTDKKFTWRMNKKIFSLPASTGDIEWSGSSKTPSWNNGTTSYIKVTGDTSATEVGTYSCTFELTDPANCAWSNNTTTNKTSNWKIVKQRVQVPTQRGTITYDKASHVPTWNSYNTSLVTMATVTAQTRAGSYSVNVTLPETTHYIWSNGVTAATTQASWSIAKRKLSYSFYGANYTYDGQSHSVSISFDSDWISGSGTSSATNANENGYTYTFSLRDTTNTTWSNGTTAAKTEKWYIYKKTLYYSIWSTSYTYDGQQHGPSVSYDSNWVSVGNTQTAVNANENGYTISFSLRDGNNTKWSDGTNSRKDEKWYIYKRSVGIPSVYGDWTYEKGSDGRAISRTADVYWREEDYVNQYGTITASNAGTYTITWSLKSSSNTKWQDDTTSNKTGTWYIRKRGVGVPYLSSSGWKYDGNEHQVQVYNLDETWVSYYGTTKAANTGSYTVTVSLRDSNNTQWSDGVIDSSRPLKWEIYGEETPHSKTVWYTGDYVININQFKKGNDTMSGTAYSSTDIGVQYGYVYVVVGGSNRSFTITTKNWWRRGSEGTKGPTIGGVTGSATIYKDECTGSSILNMLSGVWINENGRDAATICWCRVGKTTSDTNNGVEYYFEFHFYINPKDKYRGCDIGVLAYL